jgi:DNA-binding Xre family transcriptional regulator
MSIQTLIHTKVKLRNVMLKLVFAMFVILTYVINDAIIIIITNNKKVRNKMIRYNKLFSLLAMRGMKKKELLQVISSPTIAALGKNEGVAMETIEKLCEYFACQPGDLMEYVSNPKDEEKKSK